MTKNTDTQPAQVERIKVAWQNVATGFSGIAKISLVAADYEVAAFINHITIRQARADHLRRVVSTMTYGTPDRAPNFTVTELGPVD
jgi:hypothetical protein